MLKYFFDNVRWNVNKQYFCHLLGAGSSHECMTMCLQDIAVALLHCNTSERVEVNAVRFALNDIALAPTRHQWGNQLDSLMSTYWTLYISVSSRLAKVLLPSCDKVVRVERIVENYIICTQMCQDESLWRSYKSKATQLMSLTDKEQQYIDDVLALYQCKYYCAVARWVAKTGQDKYLANIMPSCSSIVGTMQYSHCYSNMTYHSNAIQSVVDCFGVSAVKLDNVFTDISHRLSVQVNGRNCLDTFCHHLYGGSMARFSSHTNSVHCDMDYFVKENSEIRNISIVGGVKKNQRYDVDIRCAVTNHKDCTMQSFCLGNSHCIAVAGAKQYYVAFALIVNHKRQDIYPDIVEDASGIHVNIRHTAILGCGQRDRLSVVTVYSQSLPLLGRQLDALDTIGYCRGIVCGDIGVVGNLYDISTNISPCSNMYCGDSEGDTKVHNYTYHFGDNEVSTLLDNQGNSATLLDGFVFGAKERIYYYNNNKISRMDGGAFAINADGVKFAKQFGDNIVNMSISHAHSKNYHCTMSHKGNMLFLLPLEEHSTVTAGHYSFDIVSKNRHFTVTYNTPLHSYTTNSIECNNSRLRRCLSGDIGSGDTLVMSFANITQLDVEISNCNKQPIGRAIIKESLLSTYLNYINNKNIWLTVNKLKPLDTLTLSAMVYTNANYVLRYILDMESKGNISHGDSCYYDNNMQLSNSSDSMIYPLALLYYVTVTGNRDILTAERISTLQCMLYNKNGQEKYNCLVALALKKMSKLNIDKVNVLIHYNNIKKLIVGNKVSYSYGQAIGALPINGISKQRLKSLVNINNLPKCWYYIAQIENLYGIDLVCDRLIVKPPCATVALEQLLLQLRDKSIATTFVQNDSYSLSLNGNTCYQGIDLSKLDKSDNTLVVSY